MVQIINIDIANLKHDQKMIPNHPTIEFNGSCTVQYNDLVGHRLYKKQQKSNMKRNAYEHFKWYNSTLQKELLADGKYTQLRLTHWNIRSGNSSAFIANGQSFDTISMIIGPSAEYWYCSNGSNLLTLSGSRYRIWNSESELNWTGIESDIYKSDSQDLLTNLLGCLKQD